MSAPDDDGPERAADAMAAAIRGASRYVDVVMVTRDANGVCAVVLSPKADAGMIEVARDALAQRMVTARWGKETLQ